MKKTRFFYIQNCVLAGILSCQILFYSAMTRENQKAQNQAKTAEKKNEPEKEGQVPEKGSTEKTDTADREPKSLKKENLTDSTQIRVLLMDSSYSSYEHEYVSGFANGEEFTYSPESPQLQEGILTVDAGTEGICITSITRQCGNPVYYGKIEIHRQEKGLNLINELPLETYLKAVIPSEMPSSYEQQALMAQSVCARTYAWKHMQEKGMEGYDADVDDSVNYQVYGNILPQDSTSLAADETFGQILTKEGEPVEAYYFSTSAGMTSTDEVWGASQPASYLKSVRCDFDRNSPWRKWEVSIPWEVIQNQVKKTFADSGQVFSVQVIKKNASGAVSCLQIVTENRVYELEQEYEIRKFLSPGGCMIYEQNGAQTEGGILLPSAYFSISQKEGKELQIQGGGYGHGVGMSQNAANEMAKQGYSCEEILKYFFDGVEIEEIY